VPWQRIGELAASAQITDKELIVYGPMCVRSPATNSIFRDHREKRSLPEHAPGRDQHQKYELLKEALAWPSSARMACCFSNEMIPHLPLREERKPRAYWACWPLPPTMTWRGRWNVPSGYSAPNSTLVGGGKAESLAAQAAPTLGVGMLEAEAQKQLDEIFRQSPLSVRSNRGVFNRVLKETAPMAMKQKTTKITPAR